MRTDARLRRERLLQAAVELYASDGFDVPLEKIAERAEVGRGTLYRNFPGRDALSTAVLEAHLAGLRAEIVALGARSDALFEAIRALSRLIVATSGFEKLVAVERRSPASSELFRQGVEALFAEPLARAQAAGLVRPDFAVTDVPLAALMVAGGGLARRGDDVESCLARALDLLRSGLRPAG